MTSMSEKRAEFEALSDEDRKQRSIGYADGIAAAWSAAEGSRIHHTWGPEASKEFVDGVAFGMDAVRELHLEAIDRCERAIRESENLPECERPKPPEKGRELNFGDLLWKEDE